MLFFKVEAKHNVSIGKDREAKYEKIRDIACALKKYNSDCKEAFYFVAEMSDENAVAGFVIFGDEAKPELMRFPWSAADIEVSAESVYEITSLNFGALLEAGEENDLTEGIRYNHAVKEKLNLFSRNYGDGFFGGAEFYREDIAEDTEDLTAFKKRAADMLWGESVLKEYDRIAAAKKHGKFLGHPVHYLFASDNFEERNVQARNMVSALYANGRLGSRRYCSISVSNMSGRDLVYLNSLYDCYVGGTIMLRFRYAARAERDMCDISAETLYKVTSLVKQYANKVLTILCFPLSCQKEKELFYSELADMAFVEFNDDAVDFERAKGYLERSCEKDGVTANEKLFSEIDSEKTYRAEELDRTYADWYSDYLRSDLYPEYSRCDKVGSQILKEEVKGNSFLKLMDMTGLTEAKSVITRAVDYYKAQKAFAELGFEKGTLAMHMVFTGNPGTAKTTVARLFASIMRENGVLPSGHLVEVGRGDIVGRYVGSTAPLVKSVFKKAKGGVLFIDEAYSLVDDKDGLYGDEAINTIVQEMENHREDTCVIFAGYPDKMETFLDKNPGLRSRIAFHVPFADYSVEELLKITEYMGGDRGIVFDGEALEKLGGIYRAASANADFGNGRFVRNAIEKARMAQAARLVKCEFGDVTAEMVKTITAADIEDFTACGKQKDRIGFAG